MVHHRSQFNHHNHRITLVANLEPHHRCVDLGLELEVVIVVELVEQYEELG